MADKKISELDSASTINSDAVFPLTQAVNNTNKTIKANIELLGLFIISVQTFSSLNTTSKTILGAINEILASQ